MVRSGGRRSERRHWDDFWDSANEIDEVYSNRERIRWELEKVTSLEGAKILEVGSGSGRDSFPLIEAGAELFLLDYSLPSLELIARQLGARRNQVAVLGGDAFQLPFPDESFDVLFHQGLLEHFRKPLPEKMLTEHFRVLRPGGIILVDVPQRWHYYTALKHALIVVDKWFAGWETEYSVSQLERLLDSVGFEVMASYGAWSNPSIPYKALRKGLARAGLKLPMYPPRPKWLDKLEAGLLGTRWGIQSAMTIGTLARRPPHDDLP